MSQNIKVESENYEDYVSKIKAIAKQSSALVNGLIKLNEKWDQNTDARIVDIKLMRESVQSFLIINELIVSCYDNLDIWKEHEFKSDEERIKFLTDRLYFLRQDLESNLFINIFLRFENFIRLITASAGIANHNLNGRIIEFIDKLKINEEYKNLINILIYTRNTIHTGGIRIQNDNTLTYKGIDYKFVKGHTPEFWNYNNMIFFFSQLFDFIYEVVSHPEIKDKPKIEHNYSDITFDYS